MANELKRSGNRAEARKYFARAIDVNPLMAHRVIQVHIHVYFGLSRDLIFV